MTYNIPERPERGKMAMCMKMRSILDMVRRESENVYEQKTLKKCEASGKRLPCVL